MTGRAPRAGRAGGSRRVSDLLVPRSTSASSASATSGWRSCRAARVCGDRRPPLPAPGLERRRVRRDRAREHHSPRRAPDDARRHPRRDGKVLASSRPSYDVDVVPGRVMPSARPVHRNGQAIAHDPDSWPGSPISCGSTRRSGALRGAHPRRLHERRRQVPLLAHSHPGPRGRPRDVVAELKQHETSLRASTSSGPSASIRTRPRRRTCSATSRRSTPRRSRGTDPQGYEDHAARRAARDNPLGYEAGDTLGATGSSTPGSLPAGPARLGEARGRRAGRYRTGPEAERSSTRRPQDPIPGRDLRLSIDVELEQAIEKAMRPHAAGAVVVVDVRTGRLLALYSKPDFDPNDLSGGSGRNRVREAFAHSMPIRSGRSSTRR
jgi:penicillin-binding protein 2